MLSKKLIPVGIIIVIIAVASSVFLLEQRKVSSSLCPACNREIHSDWAYTITFKNGTRERLCCAKCGIFEQLNKQADAASATATDFATGKPIEATKALYVWNSNVEHCPIPQKQEWLNKQPMQLVWDRCIPSLIAFRSRQEAEKFQSEHGGNILDYQASVRIVKPPSSN